MLAIIETGGKQYRVSPKTKLHIEKIAGESGSEVVFDKVLLAGERENVEIGTPYLNAKVHGKIVSQGRDDKKIVFRYHSKTRYRKKKGHRQTFTEVEIIGMEK
ncbi:MAG TPA: 50S ribosomal protein L21 [Candidatus Paceibacterota bacterium]